MATPDIIIDLRGEVSPVKSKHGTFEFLRAEGLSEVPTFMLIRYAKDGVLQEYGLRMDMDKRKIFDDFSEAKEMARANRSLRAVRAPQIWDAIVAKLHPGQS